MPDCLPKWPYGFVSPQRSGMRVPMALHSCQQLTRSGFVCFVLIYGHSTRCVVVPLLFWFADFSNKWCLASSPMCIFHLWEFFGSDSVLTLNGLPFVDIWEFFKYSGYKFFIRSVFHKQFLHLWPIVSLSSQCCLSKRKYNFNKLQFISWILTYMLYLKSHYHTKVKNFLLRHFVLEVL